MKIPVINPVSLLLTVLAFCATAVITSSCGKFNDDASVPPIAKTPTSERDATAKMSYDVIGSFDCSTLNEGALNNKYRAKAVAKYGAATGPWYDGLFAAHKSNPNAYSLNPAYAKIYNYKSQITLAIRNGSKDLLNSYCIDNTVGCNTQIFWSSYLKDAIDVYLNPIKTAISNDGTLTAIEKGILNAVIQAYYDNFEDAVTYYSTDGRSCFPDPSWYGPSDAYQANFFGGIGKIIRKIINIAATMLTEIVEGSVYGALYGLILGVPFAGVGTLPAAVGGAVAGGFVGTISGINRCLNGGYVCLVSCI